MQDSSTPKGSASIPTKVTMRFQIYDLTLAISASGTKQPSIRLLKGCYERESDIGIMLR